MQCRVHSVQCTVYSVQCKMCRVQCLECNVQCTMSSEQCTMRNLRFALGKVQFENASHAGYARFASCHVFVIDIIRHFISSFGERVCRTVPGT